MGELPDLEKETRKHQVYHIALTKNQSGFQIDQKEMDSFWLEQGGKFTQMWHTFATTRNQEITVNTRYIESIYQITER